MKKYTIYFQGKQIELNADEYIFENGKHLFYVRKQECNLMELISSFQCDQIGVVKKEPDNIEKFSIKFFLIKWLAVVIGIAVYMLLLHLLSEL